MLVGLRHLPGLAMAMTLAACATASVSSDRTDSRLSQPSHATPLVTGLQVHTPTRILFVGNSYFYYNDSLHNHVQRMVVASGVAEGDGLTYKSATIGGAALSDHAVEHLLVPENLRIDAPFEIVILQGISSAGLTPSGRERFRRAAAEHSVAIRKAGGETVLYMTPAYAKGHSRYRADMIDDVASLYIETGNEIGALVIPVGLAVAEAQRRRPDIVLHKTFDHSHPELLGTYLAAATVYASLYGRSPVGIDYDYFGRVSPEDALFLQQVAQDTATAFYGRADR